MKEKLYIPKKINVGFQLREGTYTGKLAYVIYWDDKGKLRKEASWNSWRYKPEQPLRRRWDSEAGKYVDEGGTYGDQVAPQAFENVPTSGFVLNKGVGGARESWGWNARNEYIRVYDPRDFEFEISVANLLFILQESSSIKGKGLEGEFVYSWDGKDLVLLPVDSYEYRQSSQHTSLQGKKVTKADMTEGCQYLDKKGRTLIYLGRHEYINFGYGTNSDRTKRHVFYHVDHNPEDASYNRQELLEDYYGNKIYYIPERGFTRLAEKQSDEPVDNYADILEEFMNSKHYSQLSSFNKEELTLGQDFWEGLKVRVSDSYWERYEEKEVFFKYDNRLYRGSVQYQTEDSNSYWSRRGRKFPCFRLQFSHELKAGATGFEISRSSRDEKYLQEQDIRNMEFYDIKYQLDSGKELTHIEYFNQ